MASRADSSDESSSSSGTEKRAHKDKRVRKDAPKDTELESLLSRAEFKVFVKHPDGNYKVKCSLCNKSLKGAFKSDLKAHLRSERHVKVSRARTNLQALSSLRGLVRPPGQAALSPAQLHQHYTIIHLLSCNTALSTIGDLLTDEFIEALKSHPRVSGRQLLAQLSATTKLMEDSIKADLKGKPFSVLADETPCRDGVGFVCIMAATADKLHVLSAIKFEATRTMNAQGLKSDVLNAIKKYDLNPAQFVALIVDNVAYGEAAFELLQSEANYSHIIKIGCLSHILNLMAKAYTSKSLFPQVHALLDLLRKVLCVKGSKIERQVRADFTRHFEHTPAVLDFVETRWSEWLDALHWVHDHRVQLVRWLEEEAAKIHALVLLRKDSQKRDSLEQQLRELRHSLISAETRAEIAVLHEPTTLLAKFIKYSQLADPIAFARHLDSLLDLVRLIELTAADDTSVRRQVTALLGADLVLAPALIDDLVLKVKAASGACKDKFFKHSGTTISALRAISIFESSRWTRNPMPERLPEDALGEFISPVDLLHTRLEWVAAFRCPKFKELAAPAADSTAEASLRIWRSICDVVAAPRLCSLIERLFSLRQGIADVERSFSRLRAIDSAHRAAASPGTQENEFFLVANAANFDLYACK